MAYLWFPDIEQLGCNIFWLNALSEAVKRSGDNVHFINKPKHARTRSRAHTHACNGDFFFPRMLGIWEKVWHIITRLLIYLFIYFKWRAARALQFHSLSQGQSTLAQRAKRLWTSVPWRALCELVSPMGLRTMSGHLSQPTHAQTHNGIPRRWFPRWKGSVVLLRPRLN